MYILFFFQKMSYNQFNSILYFVSNTPEGNSVSRLTKEALSKNKRKSQQKPVLSSAVPDFVQYREMGVIRSNEHSLSEHIYSGDFYRIHLNLSILLADEMVLQYWQIRWSNFGFHERIQRVVNEVWVKYNPLK